MNNVPARMPDWTKGRAGLDDGRNESEPTMLRSLAALFACFAFAFAVAGCTRAQPESGSQLGSLAQAGSPPPAPLAGTEPIRIVIGAPVVVAHGAARPVFDATFPAALRGVRIEASASGTAYVVAGRRLHAVDLAAGTERWTSADDVDGGAIAAGDRLVFAPIASGAASTAYAGYDVATGRRVLTLADTYGGAIVDGVLYARGRRGLGAFDLSDGHAIWRTREVTGGAGQPPVVVGTTLLQDFWNSGATMSNAIFAIDVRTGHVKWSRTNGPHPIGYGDGFIYMDTTPCGSMYWCFHSLDVDAVDLATGKSRTHVSYLLDDVTDTTPQGGMVAAADPHVAGGYVYFRLHGRWYRYDIPRAPAHAHGVRLDGITPRAWFGDGTLLATHGDELDVVRSFPDRIELHRLARGALRSAVVVRAGGTRYMVAGEELVAVDSGATRARVVGRVPCAAVVDLLAWGSRVAVRCAADAGGAERVLGFDDLPDGSPPTARGSSPSP